MAEHVACQALLNEDPVKYGWLRRRDILHEKGPIKLMKSFKWPKVYAVVHDGYLYLFSNERSDKPSKFFQLYFIQEVTTKLDADTTERDWSFGLVNQSSHKGKTYVLGAASRRDMMDWVDVLTEQIRRAREKGPGAPPTLTSSASNDDSNTDDYDKLDDCTIKFKIDTLKQHLHLDRVPAPLPLRTESCREPPPVPSVLYTDVVNDGTPEESDLYFPPAHRKLPPTPYDDGAQRARSAQRVPPVAPKPNVIPKDASTNREFGVAKKVAEEVKIDGHQIKPIRLPIQASLAVPCQPVLPQSIQRILPVRPYVMADQPSMDSEDPYEAVMSEEHLALQAMWNFGAKECHRLLAECAEDGVYLIRKAEQCEGSLTLVCHVGGAVRKYKIGEKTPGSKEYTLDITKADPTYFHGLSGLISHYMTHPLPTPGYEVSLARPYKVQDYDN